MGNFFIYICCFFAILFSCKNENQDKNNASNTDQHVGDQVDDIEDYDEDDYYRVQGIIVKSKVNFSYSNKFTRNYTYIYHLEYDTPLSGVETGSSLVFGVEEPVGIMVNKKDSTISFIGHRGVINEELLVDYLTKPDSDYESWLEKDYLNQN